MVERQLLEVHKYVYKYVCHKNPFLAKALAWGTVQLLPCRRNISVMKMYPHWKCQWENTYFKMVD